MREPDIAPQTLDEEAILKVACKITASEARVEYLQPICGDNQTLSARVAKLLHVYDQQPTCLENAGLAEIHYQWQTLLSGHKKTRGNTCFFGSRDA